MNTTNIHHATSQQNHHPIYKVRPCNAQDSSSTSSTSRSDLDLDKPKIVAQKYISDLFNYLSRVKPYELYLIKLSIKYKYSKGESMSYQTFGGLSPPK